LITHSLSDYVSKHINNVNSMSELMIENTTIDNEGMMNHLINHLFKVGIGGTS